MSDRQTRTLYVMTFMASLFLSAIAIATDPVVNNDGVWYLSVARVFAAGEWQLAVQSDVFYKWPFYSFLIGSLSSITGLDVESSAWVINSLFVAVTVTSFVAITRELGADQKTQWIAAGVFLLFPTLNDYRSFIIRDMGYLACYSVGLLFFLQSVRTQSIKFSILWALVMVLGVLFRTEAIVFLVAAPLAIFFMGEFSWKERARLYLKNNILLTVLAIPVLAALVYVSQAYPDKEIFGLMNVHFDRVLSVILKSGEVLARRASPLHETTMSYYSIEFTMAAILVLLVYIFAYTIIKAVTLPYVFLWWYAKRHEVSYFNINTRKIWLAFVIINVMLTSVFLYTATFLVTRYVFALSLTLLLCVPFLLSWFHRQWRQGTLRTRKQRIAIYLVAGLAVVLALDSFISTGAKKTYLKDAGVWLSENMQPGNRLYSSNVQVKYYADNINLLDYQASPKRALDELIQVPWQKVEKFLETAGTSNYDYVALGIRRKKDERLSYAVEKLGDAPVRVFENNRGDRIAIFKRVNTVKKEL